jgi:hypothetical protein
MTIATLTRQHVGSLILCRLLIVPKRPRKNDHSAERIRKDVSELCKHPLNEEEWGAALQQLVDAKLVTTDPPRLTDEGRRWALNVLGWKDVPPRTNWKQLKSKYLILCVFNASPDSAALAKKVATKAGLAGQIIRQHFALPDRGPLTPKAAVEALACRLICRELDIDPESEDGKAFSTIAKIGAVLPAHLAGVSNNSLESLRTGLIWRWLDSSETAGDETEPTKPAEVPVAEARQYHLDPATFAATVQAAARTATSGRWGDNKVFINHVWRQLQQEPNFPQLSLNDFKDRLVEANQRGLLRLERADLVEAMNTDDVYESETRFLTATYHFILIERNQP